MHANQALYQLDYIPSLLVLFYAVHILKIIDNFLCEYIFFCKDTFHLPYVLPFRYAKDQTCALCMLIKHSTSELHPQLLVSLK